MGFIKESERSCCDVNWQYENIKMHEQLFMSLSEHALCQVWLKLTQWFWGSKNVNSLIWWIDKLELSAQEKINLFINKIPYNLTLM